MDTSLRFTFTFVGYFLRKRIRFKRGVQYRIKEQSACIAHVMVQCRRRTSIACWSVPLYGWRLDAMPNCPVCKVQSVKKQFTWKGLLYGVFCFPCGMYCCLKTNRQLYCPLCGCQVSISSLFSAHFQMWTYRMKKRHSLCKFYIFGIPPPTLSKLKSGQRPNMDDHF